jgi:hypothetical protein
MQYSIPLLGGYGLDDISSGFGNRSSPGGIGSTNHRGIDFAVPIGTIVTAPTGGKVTYAGQAQGYGNYVTILDDQGYTHQFGHLSKIGVGVGDILRQDQPFAISGNSGNSTGPHLHYGIKDASGKYVDPKSLLKQGIGTVKDLASNAARSAINAIPGGSLVMDALDFGGINPLGGGGKSWLEQLKDWITNSGFFQRLALAIIAFIVLLAAFYLMKDNVIESVVKKAKG